MRRATLVLAPARLRQLSALFLGDSKWLAQRVVVLHGLDHAQLNVIFLDNAAFVAANAFTARKLFAAFLDNGVLVQRLRLLRFLNLRLQHLNLVHFVVVTFVAARVRRIVVRVVLQVIVVVGLVRNPLHLDHDGLGLFVQLLRLLLTKVPVHDLFAVFIDLVYGVHHGLHAIHSELLQCLQLLLKAVYSD